MQRNPFIGHWLSSVQGLRCEITWHWLGLPEHTMPGTGPNRLLQSTMLLHPPRNSGKQLFEQTCGQPPPTVHAEHGLEPHTIGKLAGTQQLPMQVPPIGHTAVAWHACVQLAVPVTHAPEAQTMLSAQSELCVQPALQRGWFWSAVLQPEPSGQSALETQPAWQLFEPSGLAWQICPLVQSESCAQSARRKQALARHW
jgi:hypothetical protein